MTKDEKNHLPARNPPPESETVRCPRLGHQVNFAYCEKENRGIPCFKTLDCWYNNFDAHAHLKEKLSENDFQTAFLNKGTPKVLSLLDLIEKAKAQKENRIDLFRADHHLYRPVPGIERLPFYP